MGTYRLQTTLHYWISLVCHVISVLAIAIDVIKAISPSERRCWSVKTTESGRSSFVACLKVSVMYAITVCKDNGKWKNLFCCVPEGKYYVRNVYAKTTIIRKSSLVRILRIE